ncbi:hypothetical protein Agub_g13495 [Astrephomene gubernaculifera]|uniref:Uncharacterized protein n=1 Tax=Astrephomene gubernaculifera TaxID=47775 RepID=A0AAD3HSN4_9CHLO|nr:hypothetical protein Agub_g13495 [Astrephomene gubernaculifera]
MCVTCCTPHACFPKRNYCAHAAGFFVDEDAWPSKCALCEGRDDLHSCCFDIFIEYLLRDTVNHASVGFASVAVQPEFRSPSGQLYFGAPFTQLFHDCVDSQIQAFHMQAVPLFIPYFDQLEDTSWWESQAFQFYIAAGCVPGATILLGGFSYVNEHYVSQNPKAWTEVDNRQLSCLRMQILHVLVCEEG